MIYSIMGFTGFLLITSKFEEVVINKVSEVAEQRDDDIALSNESSNHLICNGIIKEVGINRESFKDAFSSLKYWHTMGIGFFNVCNIL